MLYNQHLQNNIKSFTEEKLNKVEMFNNRFPFKLANG
jgi:hypothetical protein